MNRLTFTINIAEFLSIPVRTPSLYNVDVKHMDGMVTELTIAPSVLRWIKDVPTLLEHIDLAAKHNFESHLQTA
jgi:hypothetical protein